MPTFILVPDLRVLNRYLTTSSDDEFAEDNPNYEVKELMLTLEWTVFDNEEAFINSFKSILHSYNLVGHYDNLLFLVLSRFDDLWAVVQHHYEDYGSKKRAKELAQLLILLKETPSGRFNNVTFKPYKGTAKCDDSIVNQWISDTLIRAIESKDYPMGEFGLEVMQMLTGEKGTLEPEQLDLPKLRAVANKHLVNPKNQIKKAQFKLCLGIYAYLEGESHLKAVNDAMFTDAQLNLLFDILELLQQIDRLQISSEPKDYMRTFMTNHLQAK